MAEKLIIWSERAISEFKQILEYFTERNGNTEYSFKIIDRTEELLEVLKQNEFIGRLTNDRKTRVVVMDVYLIFYEIQATRIEILSFWDNRQDFESRIDHKK